MNIDRVPKETPESEGELVRQRAATLRLRVILGIEWRFLIERPEGENWSSSVVLFMDRLGRLTLQRTWWYAQSEGMAAGHVICSSSSRREVKEK